MTSYRIGFDWLCDDIGPKVWVLGGLWSLVKEDLRDAVKRRENLYLFNRTHVERGTFTPSKNEGNSILLNWVTRERPHLTVWLKEFGRKMGCELCMNVVFRGEGRTVYRRRYVHYCPILFVTSRTGHLLLRSEVCVGFLLLCLLRTRSVVGTPEN